MKKLLVTLSVLWFGKQASTSQTRVLHVCLLPCQKQMKDVCFFTSLLPKRGTELHVNGFWVENKLS